MKAWYRRRHGVVIHPALGGAFGIIIPLPLLLGAMPARGLLRPIVPIVRSRKAREGAGPRQPGL